MTLGEPSKWQGGEVSRVQIEASQAEKQRKDGLTTGEMESQEEDDGLRQKKKVLIG